MQVEGERIILCSRKVGYILRKTWSGTVLTKVFRIVTQVSPEWNPMKRYGNKHTNHFGPWGQFCRELVILYAYLKMGRNKNVTVRRMCEK
jgi:hypothetical protein